MRDYPPYVVTVDITEENYHVIADYKGRIQAACTIFRSGDT